MDFSNLVCRGCKSVAACIAPDEKARVIDTCGIAFFDRYLKGEDPGVLELQDPALSDYRYQL
jgi:hypothetical protein